MALVLEVNFDCVAKETLFLQEGWGIRDIRGPYLSNGIGSVLINKAFLHRNVPTNVTLSFSLSNRSLNQGIEVEIDCLDIKYRETIIRNGSTNVMIPSVLSPVEGSILIMIKATSLDISSSGAQIRLSEEILSLDQIRLERNINPKIMY